MTSYAHLTFTTREGLTTCDTCRERIDGRHWSAFAEHHAEWAASIEGQRTDRRRVIEAPFWAEVNAL